MSGAANIILGLAAGFVAGLVLGMALAFRKLNRTLIERQRELAIARSEARTDSLTKLSNRSSFDEQLRLCTASCRRYGSPLSLVMIDLDSLKTVNDRYGHAAGDAALIHLANIMRESSRESDFSARLGGDEFALLLPYTALAGAKTLAERIRRGVESSPCPWPTRRVQDANGSAAESPAEAIRLRVSAGIAEFHADGTPAELVANADRGLYVAKGSGGNSVATVDAKNQAGYLDNESSTR